MISSNVSLLQMNTLAGRILMSYVTAHIIGFLTLAISMHIDVKQDNRTSCMVLGELRALYTIRR